MKTVMEETTNVIEVSFNQDQDVEIAHPASKNFPIEDEYDPLEDLMSEFDDAEDLILEDEKEDFIFHHQKPATCHVEYTDTPEEMVEAVSKQTHRLREDLKRLKYYLDEMNIDD